SGDLETDPHHCGRCGHDCLGGACAAGKCQPHAMVTTGHPQFLAVGATDVYYTARDNESVLRLGKDGCSPQTVCRSPRRRTEELQIDATNAYFAFRTPSDAGALGGIGSCPLSGGAPTELAGGQDNPVYLILAGRTLYWAQGGPDPDLAMRLPLGGAPENFATG